MHGHMHAHAHTHTHTHARTHTDARAHARACAQATFTHWICDFLVSETYLYLIGWMGAWGTYLLYAFFSACGGLFIFFYLPETAGLKLEAVEAVFQGPLRVHAALRPVRLAEEVPEGDDAAALAPDGEPRQRETCAMS